MYWSMEIGRKIPQQRVSVPGLYAGFATGADAFFALSAGRLAAHQMSATPTNTAPALDSCSFDKPQRTLWLRRINSTKKRPVPARTRY